MPSPAKSRDSITAAKRLQATIADLQAQYATLIASFPSKPASVTPSSINGGHEPAIKATESGLPPSSNTTTTSHPENAAPDTTADPSTVIPPSSTTQEGPSHPPNPTPSSFPTVANPPTNPTPTTTAQPPPTTIHTSPLVPTTPAQSTQLQQPAQEQQQQDHDERVLSAARAVVKRHIKLLHDYNGIRDIGQGLLGLIAEQRGVRVVDVMREFGVGVGD